jgi:4-amino-4-deoxy-L-arabinose transferase-like glycosyltransferase
VSVEHSEGGRSRPGRVEILALVAILILAAVLRWVEPGVVEFKLDEANLSQLSLDFARGRSLPLLGISSSVGFPNPPISVYIFSIPYWFTSNPIVATQFVGLLNILAVLLTYILTRRYYGAGAALLAAILFAVSPWSVIYSRKIWAQDVLPPFVLATLLTALLGFMEGKRWAQWLCLPLLTFTIQIHYSAVAVVAPIVYLFWIGRARWTRAFFLSFIPAVLVLVPFIFGLLQADLPSIDEIQTIVSSGSGSAAPRSLELTNATLHYAALMTAGTEIHSLASSAAYEDYLSRVPDVYFLFGSLTWGVLFSSLWLLFRAWRKPDLRGRVDGALLLWLIAPIALFSVTWTTPYLHYLIVMLPAPFILLAVGFHDAWDALRLHIQVRGYIFIGISSLLGAVVVFQVVLWLALVDFLKTGDKLDRYVTFGVPLQERLALRDRILSSHPSQVIARLDGQTLGFNDDATVWNIFLYDVPLVRFGDNNTDVFPADESILLSYCADSNGQSGASASGDFCYQTANRLPEDKASIEFQPLPESATFANGVTILGHDWSMAGQPCLDIIWGITAPTDQDYSFAVHVTNAAGQEILNADGLSWRGVYWRPGDTVVRRFCLSGDQAARVGEIAGVNLGMYTYDGANFHGVDLLDEQGAPVGQILSIHFDS